MKAWVQYSYGDEDVLQLRDDVPIPEPGDDEVLVSVHACGLNAADVHLLTGKPYLIRPVMGLRRPRVPVLGSDFAGIAQKVGSAVTHVRPGDAVMGEADRGSLAELVAVPGKHVALQPGALSHPESAALPMAALTALKALQDAKVQPGERVLVNGASSGVGVYAVQMAVASGAKVTGVCSGRNVELVSSLGAVDVIDYTSQDFTDTTERYDVIVDIVSSQPVGRCRSILSRDGRYLVVGAASKGRWIGMGSQMRATLTSPFVSQSLRMVTAGRQREDLDLIAGMVERGELRPVIDRVYPFTEAPDAVRHVHGGHARGKVVVTV